MELRYTAQPNKCGFATLILSSTAFVFCALVVQVEHKRDTNSPNS